MLNIIIQKALEGIYRINDEMLTLLTEARHLKEDSLKAILHEESKIVDRLESVIKRGIDEGYFKISDATMAANIVSHLLLIYPLRGWNFKKQYTFKRFTDLITEFVFNALNVTREEAC